MIAVELGEILGDLALAERIVQRVVDQLRLDPIARCGVAIDLQLDRRALGLLVGRDVAQLGQRRHLGQDLRRPFIEFVKVGVLQREFELRPRRPAAEPHVLRRLHIETGALDLFQLGTQPGDDLLRGSLALIARLQRDEQVAVIAGPAAAADRHRHAGDVGVGLLLREKSLGNDDKQVNRQSQRREEDQERRQFPAHGYVKTALIGMQHRVETALAPLIKLAMLGFAVRAQEAGGHHRRQRQRHHHRYEDRHRQRDREFAEQPPDDAAHQEKRDQHRDQRDTDRDDGEPDFAGALERRRKRLLAFLDITRDVFQHHDGVVDHESDGNRQSHQGQIVEGIAEHPHQCAGAEQGERHGDGWNDGCPEAAQEDENDHDHERNGQQQRKLNVRHGGANGLGAVADDLNLDRRRYGGNQPRQHRFDLVHGLDDIGAGLLEHHQEHAALAVGPGRLLGVFRSRDGLSDVANPQRAAVAVGDDDVVPVLGVQQLIVGVDRVLALVAVDVALRAVDRRDRDLVANVFQRQALGDQFRRIDLHADRRLLLTADDHLRHAGNLADLLCELGVDRVAHRGERQGI